MESIQAVRFNAAINITSLSYSRATQPPLINISVSSVLATNHMTARSPIAPGQEGPAADGAQRARTGTALDTFVQGQKEEAQTGIRHHGVIQEFAL